jgi:glycosyltransferase involved in cell wall biosynthesis
MPPAVSIIIPHFNRADLLHETLRSLQAQTRSDWEAIVVDDGSAPEEWQRAQAFADSRVQFLRRVDGLKGPSRCRNLGLAKAIAPYVMFVDSDDVVAPWCLEQRIPELEMRPGSAFCVFDVMLFQKTPGDMATLWNRLEGENDLERFLKSDPPWHTSSPLWRRTALEKLGGFDEQIMYGDDADLHMRAIFEQLPYMKAGMQPELLPDVFIRRASADRITNTLSDALLDSRLARLHRGTLLLKRHGSPEQCRLWSGQYFVEGEFLLFNVPKSRQRQLSVLRLWRQDGVFCVWQRYAAGTYLAFARLTRRPCYIALRLARRVAMLVLPSACFPHGGEFESVVVPEPLQTAVIKQLGWNSPAQDRFSS